MKIAIPKERRPGETRVASSPDVVKKLVGFGFNVIVEKGAGEAAAFTDGAFKQAGATIAKDAASTLKQADVILKIQRPTSAELGLMKKGAVLIAHLQAMSNKAEVNAYAKAGITAFAMELMPRISRAQSMDILSSQTNLAGYQAGLEGAVNFGSAFPMIAPACLNAPPL